VITPQLVDAISALMEFHEIIGMCREAGGSNRAWGACGHQARLRGLLHTTCPEEKIIRAGGPRWA
jgi:hypothetical protein